MDELLDHRVESGIAMIGRALVAQQEMRPGGRRFDQGFGNPRLADPSLTAEQHHLSFADLGLPPALNQQGEFLIAPDDRCDTTCLPRSKSALECALRDHRKCGCGVLGYLEGLSSERTQQEQVADEMTGLVSNDHHARLARALQPCREIWGIADNRLLLRCAFTDQIADDHQSARDADARQQSLCGGSAELRDRMYDRQSCPNRPFGVILVRPWPAEIGEHAVAHELRDVALEPGDLARDRVLIGADHFAHILQIELRRHRGRADEVDEHYR